MRFAESAFKHGYTRDDIERVLDNPIGERNDYPRTGVHTVIGFDMKGNPIVVMIDEVRGVVYHAFRYEKKHEELLRWS